MKHLRNLFAFACLIGVLGAWGAALAADLMVNVRTDKTVYLMDPYYWVYSAANYTYPWPPQENPHFWPEDGYPRTVDFSVKLYDASGNPLEGKDVTFEVLDAGLVLDQGAASPGDPGTYNGSFELTEEKLGGETFTGQEPKTLTLAVTVEGEGTVAEHPVYVGRWGCDRCHLSQEVAREVYPWCSPTGGPQGPHYWGNILGRNFSPDGFDISNLTNAEKTHTPTACLNASPFHEKTLRKQGGNPACSPCHQGSGHVRYDFAATGEYPWLAHAKSEAVECTFCHGIEGGYVPADGSTWVENAGYIVDGHRHNNVPLAPDTPRDPYLARQTCSNPGCHGHIRDDKPGEVDHAKPDCRDCHGIHND